jgi:hypothetical protein
MSESVPEYSIARDYDPDGDRLSADHESPEPEIDARYHLMNFLTSLSGSPRTNKGCFRKPVG